MTIIKDLYESENIVGPFTSIELTEMWEYCIKNAWQVDGTIGYKFFKIGMLGSFESTSGPSSDSDSISPYAFSRTSGSLMASRSLKPFPSYIAFL